jgi:preprotein translocase subunit SecA
MPMYNQTQINIVKRLYERVSKQYSARTGERVEDFNELAEVYKKNALEKYQELDEKRDELSDLIYGGIEARLQAIERDFLKV